MNEVTEKFSNDILYRMLHLVLEGLVFTKWWTGINNRTACKSEFCVLSAFLLLSVCVCCLLPFDWRNKDNN